MPITPDAYQTTTTDSSDFYILVMEDDASNISYGSYYGGPASEEHVDGGTSRFDRKGKIYQAVCASCDYSGPVGMQDFPIYPPTTAVSPSNNSNCNLAVFKMDFNLPIVVADFVVPPIDCAPYTAHFHNTSLSQLYTNFEWDFGDGIGTSIQENPDYTYSVPGTYEVTLVIRDTSTCNFGDTIKKFVTIRDNSSGNAPTTNICLNDSIQIGTTPSYGTNSYSWSPATGLDNDTLANPIAFPNASTNYTLLISNGNCVQDIYLAPTNDTVFCSSPVNTELMANTYGTADTIIWSNFNQFSDTLNNITDSTFQTNISYSKIFYVKATNGNCS